MIRINLLPFRQTRKKENIRRQISIFVLSIILVCCLMSGVYYYLANQVSELEMKKQNVTVQLEAKKREAKEAGEIEEFLKALNKKLEVIDTLERNRKEPVKLFALMTETVIAKRMWFTNLELKGKNVTIDGYAMDNKTVADFMKRLEQTKIFVGVDLKSLVNEKLPEVESIKKFKVACVKIN
ncbi:MAG: PilN domain-containing protein [Desulfobacterales bacterium]|nr:PilN domain-containing protein [Desulfobacterales bacterium]